MSEEEKRIKEIRNTVKEFNEGVYGYNLALAILGAELEKALNLIEKQQEQLQEKDKIINDMAEMLTEAKFCYFKKEKGGEFLGEYRCYNKDEWIEYFTKKAREV